MSHCFNRSDIFDGDLYVFFLTGGTGTSMVEIPGAYHESLSLIVSTVNLPQFGRDIHSCSLNFVFCFVVLFL